jgi:hypothetical protein
MTQVDHGLTNVSRFDSVDLGISINDANLKTWGVTPGRSDRPSWAVEPAWVAAPPHRVFGLGFMDQLSIPLVFW